MSGWINALLTITDQALAIPAVVQAPCRRRRLTVTMWAYPHTYSKALVIADNAPGNTLRTC